MARRAGEETDLVDHRSDLLAAVDGVRLSTVLRFDRHELVAVRLDGVRDAEQRQSPLRRRGVTPSLEGRFGRTHRPIDVRGSGHRGTRVLLPRRRVHYRRGATVGAVAPLTTDEVSEGVTA